MSDPYQDIDDLPRSVTLLKDFNPEGHVLVPEWFGPNSPLKFENGKPHVNAILILADLMFWHRPAAEYDQDTGLVVGYRKRFKEDVLQRKYSYYEDFYGFSKKQVKTAIVFLEDAGFLKREFRTINTSSGPISNVMFIHLNSEKILESKARDRGVYIQGHTPPSLQGQTYTKTTLNTKIEGALEKSASPSLEENVVLEKRKKGTRLSPTWELPQEYREWAIERGVFNEQIDKLASKFRDYWIAQPGKNAAKLDWFATWRNWLRDDKYVCLKEPTPKTKIEDQQPKIEDEQPQPPLKTSDDPKIQQWYSSAETFIKLIDAKKQGGTWKSWFERLECLILSREEAIFRAPTKFIAEWFYKPGHMDLLRECLTKIDPEFPESLSIDVVWE